MTSGALRVASVQFQHRAGDKAYNLARIAAFVAAARARQVRLVAFPEMCISGYWHVRNLDQAGLEALAEPLAGPSLAAVAALARQSGVAIGAGWLERADDGRLFNSYALCMPDGACPVHRKLHAFEHPIYDVWLIACKTADPAPRPPSEPAIAPKLPPAPVRASARRS